MLIGSIVHVRFVDGAFTVLVYLGAYTIYAVTDNTTAVNDHYSSKPVAVELLCCFGNSTVQSIVVTVVCSTVEIILTIVIRIARIIKESYNYYAQY